MNKKIIIIGGGIAGLSAGCYGRMNGYDTEIFEMHKRPGGQCTAWTRKGYTFDGCIHWLVGSSPANNFYEIWAELGAVQGRQMIDHEEFMRIEDENGKTFIVYTNIDRFEAHLKELSPTDSPLIEEFANLTRLLVDFNIPLEKPLELMNLRDFLKLYKKNKPQLKAFMKYNKITMIDFASRFKDPFLRRMFPKIFGLDDFSISGLFCTLAWMHNRCAGYPLGGSLEFSKAIEKRYLDLGGEIHYGSRVEKILVEKKRAIGVKVSDGSEHFADTVISAADGHATIFDMLDGKYINRKIRNIYDTFPVFPPLVMVFFGVNRDFSSEPHSLVYFFDKPVEITGKKQEEISVKHMCYDPTMAPSGKSVVTVMMKANYEYWENLYKDKERYNAEKKKIADIVASEIEKRYPGFKSQIEVTDVATPMTCVRYTGVWKAAFEGWLPTPKTFGYRIKKRLPGLKNFYMIGQWVEPGGGLPPAAKSGRDVIHILCKKNKKNFITTKP